MFASEPAGQLGSAPSYVPNEQDGFLSTAGPGGRKVPYRIFLVADVALVWLSAGGAYAAQMFLNRAVHLPTPAELHRTLPLDLLFLFSVFVALFAHTQGLYEFPTRRTYREDLKCIAETVICSAILIGVGGYLGGDRIGMAPLMLTQGATWSIMAAWRKLVRSQSIPGLTATRNVLIVGFGRMAHELERQLAQNPALGYRVKGFVSRRRVPRANDRTPADDPRLLGSVNDITEIARAQFVDEILICVPSDRNLVMEITQKAQAAGVQVRVIPDLYDGLATEKPIEYIGQFPTIALCNLNTPTLALMLKRIIDIVFSGLALIALAPVFLVTAILVKLDSPGPVFFRAVRVGRKGTTFSCYKFRTMVANAEELKSGIAHLNERDGILFKIAMDPRITRLGRYLRKFSVDELPQFWNVLRGEMSLVGPRPPACGEYSQYDLDHLCRLDVTPGLTGLWQVTARRDPSFQNYIQLDKEYVTNWSLGLDFKILFKTIGVVLAGTGQ
jgi:exopolysaccharide biosynthesis polyprenyl glycosylphosphotransferase